MLFAPIYIAMTFIRSWRIRSFRVRLLEFLSGETSVAFCKVPENAAETPTLSSKLCTNPKDAYLCDQYYTNASRICSMKPIQCIDLSDWVTCAGSMPLGLQGDVPDLEWDISLLLECEMDPHAECSNHNYNALEWLGLPVAWKAGSHLAIVLRSTIELLSVAGFQFVSGEYVITRNLPVVRIQTVQLSGEPNKAIDTSMKSLRSEVQSNLQLPRNEFQWQTHASLLRKLSKVVGIKTENRITNGNTVNGNGERDSIQRKSVTLADVSVNTGKSLTEDSPTDDVQKSIQNAEKTETPKTKDELNIKVDDEEDIIVENVTVEIQHNITPKKSSLKLDLRKGTGQLSASLLNISSQIKSVTTHKRIVSVTGSKKDLEESGECVPQSLRVTRPLINTKSMNVLIYSDSVTAKENLEASLRKVLDCDRYTIYSVSADTLCGGAWRGRAALVAVCGSAGSAAGELLAHLLGGGRVLALCSDLLHTVLPYYKTAEVRENEVVQFSYDRWQSVRMKHHIFCYQASPAKKQFSTENDKHISKYDGHPGHELEVKVLASEETWRTPSLLQASDTRSQGVAIFSQIHLEADPSDYLTSEAKETETARLDILRKIVGDLLGLQVRDPHSPVERCALTRGFFLGNHVDKLLFVNEVCKDSLAVDGKRLHKLGDTTLQFCLRDEKPLDTPSDNFLPVFVYECPENFSTVEYFDNLSSKQIGRLVLYWDVISSTQTLAEGGVLSHGAVVVGGRQAGARGRQGNAWLSHKGQACLTVQLHMRLSESVSLVQHCGALAAVLAVRTMPGYEHLDIRIKWPNDIYYGREVKIGGNLTTASCFGDKAIINTGTGVNISNSLPTTCVNDIIAKYNRMHNTKLASISVELFLARYCSQLEVLLALLDEDKNKLFELYYKYWLHDNEEVKLSRAGAPTPTQGTVIGLDEQGWLRVRIDSGETSVAPDGNTFDMMRGLIAPK